MPNDLAATIPTALRAELGRQTVTRAELAKRLGKSSDWVGRRLSGKADTTLRDLDQMCEQLHVEMVVEFRPIPPKKTAAADRRRRPRT